MRFCRIARCRSTKSSQLRTFARFWDLIGNSGNFTATLELWLTNAESPFAEFLRFSNWLYTDQQRRHGIALNRLYELVFHYLTVICNADAQTIAAAIWCDYQRQGRRDCPAFLSGFSLPRPLNERNRAASNTKSALPIDRPAISEKKGIQNDANESSPQHSETPVVSQTACNLVVLMISLLFAIVSSATTVAHPHEVNTDDRTTAVKDRRHCTL